MALVVPTGSTPFPSEGNMWQAFANSVQAELNRIDGDISTKPSLAGLGETVAGKAVAANDPRLLKEWVLGNPGAINANTVTTPGTRHISGANASASTNLPRAEPVDFAHYTDPAFPTWGSQTAFYYGTNPQAYWRTSRNSSGAWNAWERIPTLGELPFKGNPAPIAADTHTTPGLYHLGGPNATASTGLPRAEPCDFEHITDPGNPAWATQRVTYYGTNPEMYWRVSRNTTGTWNAWVKVGATATPTTTTDYGLAQLALRDEWMGRVGGPVFTGKKAAVALRFDHGLTTMKSTIVPLLTARSLKWCMAINSRNWGIAQNSGATKADVIAWCSQGGEVWNHGATHADRTDQAGIYDEIVTGLAELRADLPGVPVDGYIPAGVGGTGLNGFNGGTTPAEYTGTYAGQLILSNHAVGAGNFSGTSIKRTLDGTPKIGQGHTTMDTLTLTAIKARIDAAIAGKFGLQLMVHPDNVGQPGFITLADLTAVFDYIVSKRTSGDLVALSPYELVRADSRF